MSNHDSRPAPQTSADRHTATYPTNPFAGWRDRTPTGQVPPVAAAAPSRRPSADAVSTSRTRAGAGTHACQRPGPPSTDRESIQDMGRPGRLSRPSMAWHPSLMQLAIGAAVVLLALTGACRLATDGMAGAYRHCHELAVSDRARAERECRGTGEGTPQPERAPTATARPEQPPAPSQQTPASPEWTVHGTDSPYDRTDPSASPLDLPRCTTAPSTPLPCLATVSPDSRRVVVLEEDASLTALVRR